MTKATLTEGNIQLGLAYSSEAQSFNLTMRGHDHMQTAMVLEKELRALHLDLEAAEGGRVHTDCSLSI